METLKLQVYHKYNVVAINFLSGSALIKLYQNRTLAVLVTNTFVEYLSLKVCKSVFKHSGILLLIEYADLFSHSCDKGHPGIKAIPKTG